MQIYKAQDNKTIYTEYMCYVAWYLIVYVSAPYHCLGFESQHFVFSIRHILPVWKSCLVVGLLL